MSIGLRVVLICLALAFNFLVLVMVRKGLAELKYALIWLAVGLALLLLCAFPALLDDIAWLMHIAIPANAAFFLAILFLMIILLVFTVVLSDHKKRICNLTQNIALLEKRIGDLEKKAQRDCGIDNKE